MSNPYKTGLLAQVYGYLSLNSGPIALTEIAETLGVTYNALYGAISRDSNKEGAIVFITESGARCAVLASAIENADTGQLILGAMRGAEAMTLKEIAKAACVMEDAASSFIRDQNKLGNIDITPARANKDYRYEWIGPVSISSEIKQLAKELDKGADDYSEVLTGLGVRDVGGVISKAPEEMAVEALSVAYTKHKTPEPMEGNKTMGKMESKQSAYMVVANGETSLIASKEKADELASEWAKHEEGVFIYEIVSANQVVYKPTTVAHDLSSLCS